MTPVLPPPFYKSTDNRVRLFQLDAWLLLRAMQTAVADALITDPPYCSGGLSTSDRQRDPRVKYCQNGNDQGRPTFGGDARDQRSYLAWLTLWLMEGRRVVREGGYVMLFCDWRQLPVVTDAVQAAGFVWRGVVSWDKGRSARAPHKGYFRHQCEYVVWGSNGPLPKATHAGPFDGCIREPVRRNDKFLMTGKPTAVMRQLVRTVVPDGLIVDPFAGSGTTAVAAAMEGRRCISADQEPAYLEIAASRLQQVTSDIASVTQNVAPPPARR